MLCRLTLVALGSFALVEGSVQKPNLTSCSGGAEINISDVAIQDAQIGKMMCINFTLTISKPLERNPTLNVTIKTEEGKKVGCFKFIGSCDYAMCGGKSMLEMSLGQKWNNTCPVPKIRSPITVQFPVPNIIQYFIGKAPTKINVTLDVYDGGLSMGCESFYVLIEAEAKAKAEARADDEEDDENDE